MIFVLDTVSTWNNLFVDKVRDSLAGLLIDIGHDCGYQWE